MNTRAILFSFMVAGSLLLSGYSLPPITDDPALEGHWIRKTDNLRIEIRAESRESLHSFIVAEGKEEFPCDVTAMAIYKNIIKIKENLWGCKFLVVTLGDCTVDYEEGIIRLNKLGEMEINCPGFEKKVYTRLKPRYGS